MLQRYISLISLANYFDKSLSDTHNGMTQTLI